MVWYKHPIFVCVCACILPNIGGFLGSLVTDTKEGSWYYQLEKPSFNPPNWLFFPAWSILYTLIGFASFRIWYKCEGFNRKSAIPLAAFAVQLILNWMWTPIFFGAQALGWAFVEIVIMWVAIVITTFLFFRVDLIAGFCMLPYIGWITFAATLNWSLWYLNK